MTISEHRNGLLFLCIANSARSQMAEGFARFLGPSSITSYSAGYHPGELSPMAVRAMKEVGIDISGHRSKGLGGVPMQNVATIVTLCDEAQVPEMPHGVHHLHWPLPDPSAITASEDETLLEFRRVRDQIRELVSQLF